MNILYIHGTFQMAFNSAIYKYYEYKQLYVLFLFAPLFCTYIFVQSIHLFKPT